MSHLAFNPTNGHLIWHSTSGHLCYKSDAPGDCPEVPESEKVEMQIVSLTGVIHYHAEEIGDWPGHELPPPGSKDWTYFIPSMFPFSLPYQADCVWIGFRRTLALIDSTYWTLTFGSGFGSSYRDLFEARKYSGNSPVGTYTVVASSRQYPYGADYGIAHTVNNIVIAKA
jgi:hypothetical protein